MNTGRWTGKKEAQKEKRKGKREAFTLRERKEENANTTKKF
jgi:hypothetical protein